MRGFFSTRGGGVVLDTAQLLDVKNLETFFSTDAGKVKAVRGLSFSVNAGETLGIVGESGSGKSVTSELILRLQDNNAVTYAGEVNFRGENLLEVSEKKMRDIRGKEISMVFQDPMSSLNPVYTIGNQLMEVILLHQKISKLEARKKAIEILRLTGIPDPEKRLKNFPHELSGGLRQRVMIAMALSCEPSLLIADEPTTALDVTIQSQILGLMEDLKQKFDMGIILITHDLAVVAEVCTRVAVMYYGDIVEETDVISLFENPLHPYTRGLLKSIPHIEGDTNKKLHVIEGTVPSLKDSHNGCPFRPRCAFATEQCNVYPDFIKYKDNHKVKCWNYKDVLAAKGDE